MGAVRSTGEDLRSVRRWATGRSHSGIGRGWWGWAWVWLNLVRAGLVADDPASRLTIARRMRREPPPGSPLVGAMVGGAAGPTVAALLARIDPAERPLLDEQVALWRRACGGEHGPDFLDGAAGALVAAAEIDALCPGAIGRSFVARLHEDVGAALRAHLAPARPGAMVYLGLAHGIAGFLLALEVGRAAFALPLPRTLRARAIDHLMAERLRGPGNIAGWPVFAAADPLVPNAWCNGTAGVALAALAGQRLSGDPAYDRLADVALPSTFALRGGPFAAFCCGTIGQAQILLEAHRLLGDRSWLARARRTAELRALPRAGNRTFNQGVLGARYLELRLRDPRRLPLPGLGGLSAPL
jgi:hypothetical protein